MVFAQVAVNPRAAVAVLCSLSNDARTSTLQLLIALALRDGGRRHQA